MSLSIWEIIGRAKSGPIMSGKTYDMEVFVPKLREMAQKYKVEYDPSTPVPNDDDLVRRVFEAALEFYSEVGTYCVDTGRVIKFKRNEILESLKGAPHQVVFGEGKDLAIMKSRKIEDKVPPFLWLSAGSFSTDEELFGPIIECFIQEPLAQIVSMPTIREIYKIPIGVGDPTEYLGATRTASMINDARSRAGRPGIACGNAVTAAITSAGILAATRPGFGLRPSDGYFTHTISELKIDMDRLTRNTFMLDWNANIIFLFSPILGGLCGGANTLAIANVAYYLMGAAVCKATGNQSMPLHFLYSNNSHRAILWAVSLSQQAVSQYTHLPSIQQLYARNGPATKEIAYEAAAWALAVVSSGGNVGGIGFCGGGDRHRNYCNPLDSKLLGEVACGAVGINRQSANKIVNDLLLKYEKGLDEGYNKGKPFTELYDVKTRSPLPETLEHYEQMKFELKSMGIPFE
jgi:methylamine--corrinoid protein Co-methyltransferase